MPNQDHVLPFISLFQKYQYRLLLQVIKQRLLSNQNSICVVHKIGSYFNIE